MPADRETFSIQKEIRECEPASEPRHTVVCALGCGNMGEAIFSGILRATETHEDPDFLSNIRLVACVRRADHAAKLSESWTDSRVSIVSDTKNHTAAVKSAQYVLLAVKPHVAHGILTATDMQNSLVGKVVISVIAGLSTAVLKELCPKSHVIRIMPNRASYLQKGMSVISRSHNLPSTEYGMVDRIFKLCGETVTLCEEQMDVATALCGSGPAFLAVILDSMALGAESEGIAMSQAIQILAQTMLGTASMIQDGREPIEIKDAVATRGGCSASGLSEMKNASISEAMIRTIQTTTKVAKNLANRSITQV